MLITFARVYVIVHWFQKSCFHCLLFGQLFMVIHFTSLKENFMQNESPVIITILALYALLSHLQNEKEDILKVMLSIFFPLYCYGFLSKLQNNVKTTFKVLYN